MPLSPPQILGLPLASGQPPPPATERKVASDPGGSSAETPIAGMISGGDPLANGTTVLLPVQAGGARPGFFGRKKSQAPAPPSDSGRPRTSVGSQAVKAAGPYDANEDDSLKNNSSLGTQWPVPTSRSPVSSQATATAAGFAQGQQPSFIQPQQQEPCPPPTNSGSSDGRRLQPCRPVPPPRASSLPLPKESGGVRPSRIAPPPPPLPPSRLPVSNGNSLSPVNRLPIASVPPSPPPAMTVALTSSVQQLPMRNESIVGDINGDTVSAHIPSSSDNGAAPAALHPASQGGPPTESEDQSLRTNTPGANSRVAFLVALRQLGGRSMDSPVFVPTDVAQQLPQTLLPSSGSSTHLTSPPKSGRSVLLSALLRDTNGSSKPLPSRANFTDFKAVPSPSPNGLPFSGAQPQPQPAVGAAASGSQSSALQPISSLVTLMRNMTVQGSGNEIQLSASSCSSPGQEVVFMEVGSVTVEAVIGDIVDENTDAIVNGTNNVMDLTGCVSRKLLDRGGSKISADCKAKGEIGSTGVFSASAEGTSLQCKCILHVDVHMPFDLLVQNCLKEADRLKLCSISFPALGTGKHQKDPENAIDYLVAGVQKFLTDTPLLHLQLIRFVAFDSTTMDIFKRKISVVPGTQEEWMKILGYQEHNLSSQSQEYEIVKTAFFSTASSNLTIKKIKRIQNPTLLQQYELQKQKVAASMPSNLTPSIERCLWHGTNEDSHKKICMHGFNRSYCGVNGVLYGQGVYFARDAAYSTKYSHANKTGVRHMIYSRVLTGEFTLGDEDMRVPPARTHGNLANYDASVDSVEDPSIFVVYHDSQAYPEFVIEFF